MENTYFGKYFKKDIPPNSTYNSVSNIYFNVTVWDDKFSRVLNIFSREPKHLHMLHKGVLYIKQDIFGAPCRYLREPQESSREPAPANFKS